MYSGRAREGRIWKRPVPASCTTTILYLDDGRDRYYFSEDGITEDYDYKLGFYNFFQYPYINRADVMRTVEWLDDAVFYQIFVDRFCRGDAGKDDSYINCRWGDIPTPSTFAGGDLVGIRQKLPYIRDLGCNALYLTPVFQSVSNHKYDISDYYQVDEQFGGNRELGHLVEEAHRLGMKVVLDAVFNHCSERLSQFQDVLKNGRRSPYYSWFIIDGERPDRERGNFEMFASCAYMPKFDTSNEEVQQFLAGVGCYYLREYGIDGWRLDVSDEVSHDFWRYFRRAVKREREDAVLIGENWHDASSYLRGDQYDSIMNYAFTKACLDYFARGRFDARQMAWRLNEIRMRNTDTVNRMMLNLLDSHDTHRFFSEVEGDQEAMEAALCLLYLFPGVPCIFYGTEILTEGGYDPDCRRCMDWGRTGPEGGYGHIRALLQRLADLRRRYEAAKGRVTIDEENGVLKVKNQTPKGEILLLINRTGREAQAEGIRAASYSHCVMVNGGQII